MHDQSNSWSIQLINSFSSNCFTLLLLCTSGPLVLYCGQFDRGSRQVNREPVDLVTEDYDVSLCQRVGIHNYYTKDHIITCDRCTSGKFCSFVRWITWWQVTSDEDAMKTSHPIWNYLYILCFCGDILSCGTLEYMKLIILPAFLEGTVLLNRRKMPDPAHADDNQQRVYDEKMVSMWSIF